MMLDASVGSLETGRGSVSQQIRLGKWALDKNTPRWPQRNHGAPGKCQVDWDSPGCPGKPCLPQKAYNMTSPRCPVRVHGSGGVQNFATVILRLD